MIRFILAIVAGLSFTQFSQAADVSPAFKQDNVSGQVSVKDRSGTWVPMGTAASSIWTPVIPSDLLSTYVTPTGAPFAADLTKQEADENPLRAWGYLGDGTSHTLSTVASVNGTNTLGWTLAQWQAKLPCVSALTDEADWAALQCYVNTVSRGARITIPSGKGLLNKTLTLPGTASVTLIGAGGPSSASGSYATELSFTGGTDGITHATGTSSISLQDISITSTTLGGSLRGLIDNAANYTYLRNVNFQGFNNCIEMNNPGGTRINSTWCSSGRAAGTAGIGNGVYLHGKNSFVNHITDTLMQGYETCYYFHSTNVLSSGELGIEDVRVLNSACGGSNRAILIDSVDTNYGPFDYEFTGMSIDVVSSFLFAPMGNNISVTGGNWLLDPTVGTWSGGGNLIDLGLGTTGTSGVRLQDFWFGGSAGGSFNTLISAESVTKDVQISGIRVETVGMAPIAAYFQVANGALNVSEKDTAWTNFFTPISPPSNAVANFSASESNRLESQAVVDLHTSSPTNFSGTSNRGAIFSKYDVTGAVPGDHDRAAVFFKMTTDPAATAANAETTLAINTVSNTGASLVWAPSTAYVLNNYVRIVGNPYVYRQTTASCTSASSGPGPTGNGTGIVDGTCVWDYANDNALNYTAGFYNGTVVYPGARPTWGSAFNTVRMAGADKSFSANIEFDYSGDNTTCAIGSHNCYNIFMGMNGGVGTAWLAMAGQVSPAPYSAAYGILISGNRFASDGAIQEDTSAEYGFRAGGFAGATHAQADFASHGTSTDGFRAVGTYSNAGFQFNSTTAAVGYNCLGTPSFACNAINYTGAAYGIFITGTHTGYSILDQSTTAVGMRMNGTYSQSAIYTPNVQLVPTTVTAMTCDAAHNGVIRFVTDSNTTTFAALMAGGGSNKVLALCVDGTGWTVH
jgi:hypothetical protein